jgi:hypothetical protein
MNHQLVFNVLSFELPKSPRKFYFSKEKKTNSFKIHKSLFPDELLTYLPDVEDFCYTSFGKKIDDSVAIDIDLKTDNQDLIKRYYNALIHYYFTVSMKMTVKVGFVKENQIWIFNQHLSNDQVDVYKKFTVKVQIAQVTEQAELVISYDGTSKVFKTSVSELVTNISPSLFNWVFYKNRLLKYEHIPQEKNPNYAEYFPILNLKLRESLKINAETPLRGNRYLKYEEIILFFVEKYLNTESFLKLIPHSKAFIKVIPYRIGNVSDDSNQLIFSNGQKTIVPIDGIKSLKPFQGSKYASIHLFYIMHIDDIKNTISINKALIEEFSWFKGLNKFIGLPIHVEPNFSIKFKNKENPLVEIEEALQNREFNSNIKYIAVYVSPYGKFEKEKAKREIYYQVKELLLKRGIPSQAIDPKKMMEQGDKWVYSLPNIAVAMLAKLDGIPWRLDVAVKNELIIGVGAYKNIEQNIQYIGSAFSFSNTGQFNGFEYFMKNEITEFAGKVAYEVRKYSSTITNPERLIIHFYKTMNEREVSYIEKAILNLGLSIPIFIVSINKTESEDIIAFDKGWKDLMPKSGTYINIGRNKYLLFNNTRYSDGYINPMDGFHFPIKLKIDCTKKELLEDQKTIQELLDQVYQFSRMYWKSVRQQNLPVTIKYPEIIAQMAPHFVGEDLPEYGKRSLWFL